MTDADLDSGTRKLIDDLLLKPQSYARDEIVHRARRFRYHDYKSDDQAPNHTLYRHLLGAGFKDLALNVTQGKYDQDSEEGRKWAETEEGRRFMATANSDPALRNAMNALLDGAVRLKPQMDAAVREDLSRYPDAVHKKQEPS